MLRDDQAKYLEEKALYVRQELWRMAMKLGRGHIPSCFSCVDILVALYYGDFLKFGSPKERDRVIVSKGHASATLYPILADRGYFSEDELFRFGEPGALLGMFADPKIPGVDTISDSLGHGLSIGCGLALAAKRDGRDTRVYVILGDAECNEGSVWEAAAFASHYGLNNLTVIVDHNRLGILGQTVCIGLDTFSGLAGRWSSFGWECLRIDGHSFEDLCSTLSLDIRAYDEPLAIVANTVKGKGISFMENKAEWHNKMPDKVQEAQGWKELGLEIPNA